MRDVKDPGTIELKLPARRGRPSLFGMPLSAAERARRYRRRKEERRNVAVRRPAEASDVGLLEELRASMYIGQVTSIHRVLAEIAARYPIA